MAAAGRSCGCTRRRCRGARDRRAPPRPQPAVPKERQNHRRPVLSVGCAELQIRPLGRHCHRDRRGTPPGPPGRAFLRRGAESAGPPRPAAPPGLRSPPPGRPRPDGPPRTAPSGRRRGRGRAHRTRRRSRMIPLLLFLLGVAAVYVGTIETAFSALMKLSLRLMAERGRDDRLGYYLDDPIQLFVPARLLLGLIFSLATVLLAVVTGRSGINVTSLATLLACVAVYIIICEHVLPSVI